MDPKKPVRLAGTKVFLAGTRGDPKRAASRVNLVDPETIEWLKATGITKVFCIFPLTKKQFEKLASAEKRGTQTPREFLQSWGIDPNFKRKLKEAGIAVSSLVRKPEHIKGNRRFLQEAARIRGNFLIQCFAGRHISGAYAMLYLAAVSKLDLHQIRQVFMKSGIGKDLPRIEEILKETGADLREIIERKEAKKAARTKKRRANARRKEIKRRRGKHKL